MEIVFLSYSIVLKQSQSVNNLTAGKGKAGSEGDSRMWESRFCWLDKYISCFICCWNKIPELKGKKEKLILAQN